MIKSFKDHRTQAVARGENPKGFPSDLLVVARRKLGMLDAATNIEDLRYPPNNGLKPLKRRRLGQHAIRINDQFRVCFVWTSDGPEDVEITDYHDEPKR